VAVQCIIDVEQGKTYCVVHSGLRQGFQQDSFFFSRFLIDNHLPMQCFFLFNYQVKEITHGSFVYSFDSMQSKIIAYRDDST